MQLAHSQSLTDGGQAEAINAGFARAWGRTGASYEQLVARLLALARSGPVA